jgi:hypothetical protein
MFAPLPISPSRPQDVLPVFHRHPFPRHHDDGEVIMLRDAFHKRSQLRGCFLEQGFGWQRPSIPDDLLS